MNLISALDSAGVPLKDFLSLLAARNEEHALLPLSELLDEEQMVSFVEKFRGSYCRAPAARSVQQALFELALVMKYRELKHAQRHGTADDVQATRRLLEVVWKKLRAEGCVHAQAGEAPPTAEDHAARIEAELKESRSWCAAHGKGVTARQAGLDLDCVPPDVEPGALLPATVGQSRAQRRAELKQQRRDAGLCVQGCGAPAVPGRASCQRHLEEATKQARARQAKKAQS